MQHVPTLQTARLILRELIESDAPAYQKHFVNYEVVRYLGAQLPWPYPEDGIIHFLKNDVIPYQGKIKWFWAICLKDDPNHLIGAVELLKIASPTNRGFWLGQPYWGRGYMTEAIEAINEYAFNELGFEKLFFGNAAGNPRSARIKEKSGARLVRREKAEYVDPAFTERDIYELTKEEWLKRNVKS